MVPITQGPQSRGTGGAHAPPQYFENYKKFSTVYTHVQVEFFGRENGLKKSTSTYFRENMRHTLIPNHKKMPKFTATSQVTELSK